MGSRLHTAPSLFLKGSSQRSHSEGRRDAIAFESRRPVETERGAVERDDILRHGPNIQSDMGSTRICANEVMPSAETDKTKCKPRSGSTRAVIAIVLHRNWL